MPNSVNDTLNLKNTLKQMNCFQNIIYENNAFMHDDESQFHVNNEYFNKHRFSFDSTKTGLIQT